MSAVLEAGREHVRAPPGRRIGTISPAAFDALKELEVPPPPPPPPEARAQATADAMLGTRAQNVA